MKRTLLFVLALIAVGCSEPIPRNLDDLSRQGPQYLEGDSLGLYQTGTYRDGQREGRSERFYPSGALYDRVSFENDRFPYDSFRREGRSEHFYPSGTLYDRVSWENDKLDGPAEYYYEENGQLWEKSTYTAGERDGPLEGYHENGQLEIRTTYAAGELDGPYERYYENGQLDLRGTFTAGEPDGPFERYHENGQLEIRATYTAGEPDGPFERYDENGQLVSRGVWNMGEMCGGWISEGEALTLPPC